MLCAKAHVGDETFAVILGDEIIPSENQVLDKMFKVLAKHGGSVLLLKRVPSDELSRYGVA